ncbi:MAG: hypothetical protein Tsb0019_19660 [Roseibium sp.]
MNYNVHDISKNSYLGEMLAKSATVMIWISDTEKNCIYVNDSWLAFTGKTIEEEYGFGWADGLHPDDIDRCLDIFTRAFEAHEIFSMDYRLLRADGDYRWIRDDGAPYFDTDGQFVGYIGSCFDIHDEVIARASIEKSEREYRETINGLLVGVVVHAPDGGILLSNGEASNILGLSEDQIAGRKATDSEWRFVKPDLSPVETADFPVNLVIASRQAVTNYELGVLRPDRDHVTWVNVNAKPLFDAQGELEQVIVNFVDVTARKRAEESLLKSQYKLSAHIKNTPLGCISWDEDFRCVEWNKAAERIFGYTEQEAVGKNSQILIPDYAREHVAGVFKQLLNQAGGEFSRNENVTKHGDVITCDWYNTPIIDSANKIIGVTSLVLDVTESINREAELLTQSQITSNMMEGAHLLRADDQKIVFANRALENMFGYEPGEMLGKHVSILNAPADVSPSETARKIMRELEANGYWRGEIENIKKDGSRFWCLATISSFEHPEFGKVWLSVHTDITLRKYLNEKISYQASHDSLTGLTSRAEFERVAKAAIDRAAADKSEHAMCFVDLDQFKVINDTCGHQAGDELLRQLARVIENMVRQSDTLARLGGDEFALLIKNCGLRQAKKIADTILNAIADYQFVWENKAFRVGASIGLVAIDETTATFTNLFKQADAACYLAKDLGRNRVYVFRPDDAEVGIRQGEMQWVGRINEALLNNRFRLFAQPIISFKDPGHLHYELLLRLQDEDGTVVPPGAFLPAAERYNLIGDIDKWVLKTAFDFFSDRSGFFDRVDFVTINLSAASLNSEDFLDLALSLYKESGINPGQVCFEITETTAVSNLNSAIRFIKELKRRGFLFALDDFGSGVSSFGYLRSLPVDYLKIDGMFIKHIAEDPVDFAMVKSINEIGQMMGMKTIAEYVENENIARMLKAINVDYGQGYGLGEPVPVEDLIHTT